MWVDSVNGRFGRLHNRQIIIISCQPKVNLPQSQVMFIYFVQAVWCSCCQRRLCQSPTGHVITGDLSIIDSENLRKILAKGPKYREPQSIHCKYNFRLLVDDYTRKWIKREQQEVDTITEWVKAVWLLIQIRIEKLGSMSTKTTSVFKDPEVVETLSTMHDNYVVVPADKAINNIILVWRKHYIDCLMIELDLDS